MYRQMTLGAVAAAATGAIDLARNALIAYGDVLAAWRNYLRTRNNGRPFVLIGHSQGTPDAPAADRAGHRGRIPQSRRG